MTVGYIGASGLMGHGMAKNLIAKGQKLAITVHKQRDRVKDLRSEEHTSELQSH